MYTENDTNSGRNDCQPLEFHHDADAWHVDPRYAQYCWRSVGIKSGYALGSTDTRNSRAVRQIYSPT